MVEKESPKPSEYTIFLDSPLDIGVNGNIRRYEKGEHVVSSEVYEVLLNAGLIPA